MRVPLACVADAATVSSDGKLNILGEFNCIWASNLPVKWPRMMYVARIELEPGDPQELDIQLSLLDPDSALVGPVMQLQGSIQGGRPIGTGGTAPVVLQVDGATFWSSGAIRPKRFTGRHLGIAMRTWSVGSGVQIAGRHLARRDSSCLDSPVRASDTSEDPW